MVQTGISLNERFTQMQSRQQQPTEAQRGRRSRSQSRSRRIVDAAASVANTRLLQEFKRKHTVQTALKLKRVCVHKNNNQLLNYYCNYSGIKAMN